MATRITYTDKTLGQSSTFPVDKKWRFEDANEVKDTVNAHADDIEANTANIATNTANIVTNSFARAGWAYYQDGETAPATQVFNTTPSKLQIDGLGASSENAYLPIDIRGVGDLWDSVNDKITPINIGDSYDLRIDCNVIADSGAVSYIELQLDIGGGAAPTVVIVDRIISLSKVPPFSLSIGFPIFTLGTFVANGGQIFMSTDVGTVTIDSRAILVVRNSCGDL